MDFWNICADGGVWVLSVWAATKLCALKDIYPTLCSLPRVIGRSRANPVLFFARFFLSSAASPMFLSGLLDDPGA